MLEVNDSLVTFALDIRPDRAILAVIDLLRLTEENHPIAVEAISRQARAIGKGLRFIVAALSPEMILIAGEITSVWDRFGPIVEHELKDATLAGAPPRLETAADGDLMVVLYSAASAEVVFGCSGLGVSWIS